MKCRLLLSLRNGFTVTTVIFLASDRRMTMNNELKRKGLWSKLRHYRRIFLERLKESVNNLRADRRWLRRHTLRDHKA
jgi:hypothetical protein